MDPQQAAELREVRCAEEGGREVVAAVAREVVQVPELGSGTKRNAARCGRRGGFVAYRRGEGGGRGSGGRGSCPSRIRRATGLRPGPGRAATGWRSVTVL